MRSNRCGSRMRVIAGAALTLTLSHALSMVHAVTVAQSPVHAGEAAMRVEGTVALVGGTVIDGSGSAPITMGEATLAAIEGLVELGMTPMQALVAATRNGAIAAGAGDTLGTLAVGKRADLIMLTRNPLQDITNIRALEAVMVNGRLMTVAR